MIRIILTRVFKEIYLVLHSVLLVTWYFLISIDFLVALWEVWVLIKALLLKKFDGVFFLLRFFFKITAIFFNGLKSFIYRVALMAWYYIGSIKFLVTLWEIIVLIKLTIELKFTKIQHKIHIFSVTKKLCPLFQS